MWRSGAIMRLTAVTPLGGGHSPCVGVGGQQRNMATLKDISLRLKSVSNIQKITKSMKMVAAAKYSRAERDLKPARPYGKGAKSFFDNVTEEADVKEAKPKHLLVLLTSDRGLCGSVHSNVAKMAKVRMAKKPEDVDMKLILVGDKAKASLRKVYGQDVIMSANEIGRTPPSFDDASKLAQAILSSGFEFDQCDIVYNRFKTIVSYETTTMPVLSLPAISEKEKISTYDSLDEDVLQCYTEYTLSSLIFHALKECAVSEQSSRMTAMEGASKNAGEMIERLQMEFNRTRQAVITRELIEIISGAAAV